jgi:hypothetical protein
VDKRRRADVLKISFTIAENQIAKNQVIKHTMQVIDSKNNVLGDKKIIDFGADTLTYSFMTTVKYENKLFKLQKIYLGRILKRNLFCKCFLTKIKWFLRLVLFWNKRHSLEERGAY